MILSASRMLCQAACFTTRRAWLTLSNKTYLRFTMSKTIPRSTIFSSMSCTTLHLCTVCRSCTSTERMQPRIIVNSCGVHIPIWFKTGWPSDALLQFLFKYFGSKQLLAHLETLVASSPCYRVDGGRMSRKMFYQQALHRYKDSGFPFGEFHTRIARKMASWHERYKPPMAKETVANLSDAEEGDVRW